MKMDSQRLFELSILLLLSPIAWWVSDREPPWTRVSGYIAPTYAGDMFAVQWKTTPLKRKCPGVIQTEIASPIEGSTGFVIWPVLRRSVNSDLHIGQTDYVTPAWPLDKEVLPGRAVYRVTTFWYCNWLQHYINWPVIQVGPDIEMTVLSPKG